MLHRQGKAIAMDCDHARTIEHSTHEWCPDCGSYRALQRAHMVTPYAPTTGSFGWMRPAMPRLAQAVAEALDHMKWHAYQDCADCDEFVERLAAGEAADG